MSEHAEVAFPLAGCVRLAPQRRAQQPLVPRERAFRLPALPVDPLMPAPLRLLAEALDHLPPVARLGPLPPRFRRLRGITVERTPRSSRP